jgi:phospholipid-transporting ATPase
LGTLKFKSDDGVLNAIPLDIDQMLLRGSSLRNTKWIYGIAIYTGHDSKVMMNSSNNKPKFSKLETATNGYIVMGICIQVLVCLLSAVLNSVWSLFLKAQGIDQTYLQLD